LVDFRNDCVGTALEVVEALFRRWLPLHRAGQVEEARRYELFGVRADTSSDQRDASVTPLGDPRLDCGVNPRLVFALREGLDGAWRAWGLSDQDRALAERYSRAVKIAVSGGFTPARIRQFEQLGVPVDIYGVGSWLLSSCDEHGTSADFTADVVRVKLGGEWRELAKAGRRACDNLLLERVE
jgi:nicotinate phosphoribosyltransferase